ncbi:MAG: carboxypeptidase-like regulatory domain-containing protein [Gemmatimonadetes bacterium]|nr:carboxypeptidase-like regulatory domain-containing protein [Gemmatimonadota bacterium]
MQHLDDGILQAWLDGPRSGLSASERAEIERHLSSCDACARRLEELDESSHRVQALLSGAEAADEAVPAFETVMARARQREGVGPHRPRWAAAAWAASIAAAIGLGWLGSNLYRSGGVTRTATETAKVDSATPAAVVASAKPASDTSSALAAGDTSPAFPATAEAPTRTAAATQTAAPMVVAAKPAADTSPHGGAAQSTVRPTAPLKTPTKPAASVASAERMTADAAQPAQAASAEGARVGAAKAAAVSRSDSAPALIRGRVTNESGQPLAAAQIVVAGTGVGAITRKDGTFELSLDKTPTDSATRPVTLRAQLIGYRTESRRLDARAGNMVSADFRLAPQDVALNELVVTGVAAGRARESTAPQEIVVPPDQPAWGAWRAVSRADAEAATGFALLTVPDLPVSRIDVGNASGVAIVRVVQTLDGGGNLELVEAGGPLRFGGTEPSGGPARGTARRGDVFVAATAPLTADALEALLGRLK